MSETLPTTVIGSPSIAVEQGVVALPIQNRGARPGIAQNFRSIDGSGQRVLADSYGSLLAGDGIDNHIARPILVDQWVITSTRTVNLTSIRVDARAPDDLGIRSACAKRKTPAPIAAICMNCRKFRMTSSFFRFQAVCRFQSASSSPFANENKRATCAPFFAMSNHSLRANSCQFWEPRAITAKWTEQQAETCSPSCLPRCQAWYSCPELRMYT